MEKGPALPKNIRQIGEISGREKICVEDYVMTYIRKREQQEDKGFLGIFLGEQQETDDSVYVFIRGVFEIPPELQEQKEQETIRQECEKYFGDWTVQGCCVIGVYPTERMKTLASWFPESGKLIYHLQEQEETIYWTGEEQYRRLQGYFVFYEQNQKMQEYLAQMFGNESVEKESAPDRAIRSFREKVKEKGEQKQSSFLRMASSFFVITVLVIGAIVVNRIEDIRAVRNLSIAESLATAGRLQEEGEDVPGSAASGDTTWQASDAAVAQYDASADTPQYDAAAGTSQYDANADTAPTAGTTQYDASADTPQYDAAVGTVQYDAIQRAAEEAELAGPDTFWEDTGFEDSSEQQSGEETESESDVPAAESAGLTGNQDSESDSAAEPDDSAAADAPSVGTGRTSESEVAQEAVAVRNTQAGYVIKEGDTLAGICSRYYGTIDRIEEVCDANGIEDANMILPGQRIVLP